MTGNKQELNMDLAIPKEAFTGLLGWAVLEASCYPLPDDTYRITVEPAQGLGLNGNRPWDSDWALYGELTMPENPNGSFESVMRKSLAAGNLCLSFVAKHDNYLVTPAGGVCWRYTLGVESRTARPQNDQE